MNRLDLFKKSISTRLGKEVVSIEFGRKLLCLLASAEKIESDSIKFEVDGEKYRGNILAVAQVFDVLGVAEKEERLKERLWESLHAFFREMEDSTPIALLTLKDSWGMVDEKACVLLLFKKEDSQ